ncbi:MAG: hypothetical protein LBI45_07465 [Bacteroidales bacterium]|jgi:hypothetical protein|nr:hypothetical protein [Bacteroidales bacterium]
MPLLKDYISNLVSSITDARVSSDRNSANIAESYKEDELLRDFPIPHMRIGEVVMNIPVAVDFAQEQEVFNSNPNVEQIVNSVVLKIYNELALNPSEMQDSNVAQTFKTHLRTSIESFVTDAIQNNNLDNLQNESDTIAHGAITNLGRYTTGQKPDTQVIANSISKIIRANIISSNLENVRMMVEASQLREQDPHTLINIKLTVFEEGMEWAIAGGGVRDKLVPE